MAACFGILLLPLAVFAQGIFAQSTAFEAGRLSFFLAQRPMKGGSSVDFGIGYGYTDHFFGEVRLKSSSAAEVGEFGFEGIEDSLNASEETSFAVFLTPFQFRFARNKTARYKSGAGVYYGYSSLTEKGFFNMPVLESLGKERVNSFSNDFTTHVVGPNLNAGLSYHSSRIEFYGNIDLVPVFFLNARQSTAYAPLMEPDRMTHSQKTWGSPCIFAELGIVFLRYFSFDLLYETVSLKYEIADFDIDDDLNFVWINPRTKVVSRSVKTELSLLLPLDPIRAQIGFGYAFDSVAIDDSAPVESNKPYLILSARFN